MEKLDQQQSLIKKIEEFNALTQETTTPSATSNTEFFGFVDSPSTPSASSVETNRAESERITELDNKIYKLENRIELLEKKLNIISKKYENSRDVAVETLHATSLLLL